MLGYPHRFVCRKCRFRHYYVKRPDICGTKGCKSESFRLVILDPKTGRPPVKTKGKEANACALA